MTTIIHTSKVDELMRILRTYQGLDFAEAERLEERLGLAFPFDLPAEVVLTASQSALLREAAEWIGGQADIISSESRGRRRLPYHDDAYETPWTSRAEDLSLCLLEAL